MSLFSGLITSKTRIKILMRFFLNPGQQAYLRELSNEFGISSSQVAEELDQLAAAGLITSRKQGRQINYQANIKHILFPELHSMVRKSLGMDYILDSIITRLGNLHKAILIDDYARGIDSGIIDLILVGDIDQKNLLDLVKKSEKYLERKIRTLALTKKEYEKLFPELQGRSQFVLWEK
jgi:DNA-binding transcriptional MocR family regulator